MNLEKKNRSIVYIRVFATILILLCHLVYIFDNPIIHMSAQFLCVGVHLFLIISGYLYGRREILSRTTYKKWIISRAKRILIPMYIFMFFLLIIHLLKGIDIDIIHWLAYIFNLQGLEIYVHGAQHLWYLTIAMSCYFITPILDRYRNKFNELNITVIFVVLVITQVIMTYFIYQQFGRYLIMIELYIFAYFIVSAL